MSPHPPHPTSQAELYEYMCRRMSQLAPGWTDDFPSDPAVAILELVSHLSHMQDATWNQITPSHYAAYLRLLGGICTPLTPAQLLTQSVGDHPPHLGQRFWVDGIPFEVTGTTGHGQHILSVQVAGANPPSASIGHVPLCLAGKDVALTLTFSQPLPPHTPRRIWCQIAPDPNRVAPEPDTPPPITLRAQGRHQGVWQDLPMQDGTCGLLQSGFWTMTPSHPLTTLRIQIVGELEGEPTISHLVLDPVELEQQLTRSTTMDVSPPFSIPPHWVGQRVLHFFLPAEHGAWREAPHLFVHQGHISGWTHPPDQIRVVAAEPDFTALFPLLSLAGETLHLDEEGVLPHTLQLMVQEGDVWYDCPVCQPSPHKTLPRGCRWDPTHATLCFGDGRDFCVPAHGNLLIAACVTTQGQKGNGAAGRLEDGKVCLECITPASGGCDLESPKDGFIRTVQEQELPLRAVTAQDYEDLAWKTPGLSLHLVQAVTQPSGPGITVLVKPVSSQALPRLTPWQLERVQSWLNRFRLIGVPVTVESPSYLPLSVNLSLRVATPLSETDLRRLISQHVDGVTGPLRFGAEICSTHLLSALSAVPGVLAVQHLELIALAGGVHPSPDGSIHLRWNQLSYIKNLHITQTCP